MAEIVEEFEAPLTNKRVRIYKDDSTSSGKNWEYIDK